MTSLAGSRDHIPCKCGKPRDFYRTDRPYKTLHPKCKVCYVASATERNHKRYKKAYSNRGRKKGEVPLTHNTKKLDTTVFSWVVNGHEVFSCPYCLSITTSGHRCKGVS